MKIYISIPITGHDLGERREKAAETARLIAALGHEPVNPLDTPEPEGDMTEKERYAYFMGRDVERMLLCDAAFFSAGWHKSRGCLIEHDVALNCGLQAYYSLERIKPAL